MSINRDRNVYRTENPHPNIDMRTLGPLSIFRPRLPAVTATVEQYSDTEPARESCDRERSEARENEFDQFFFR